MFLKSLRILDGNNEIRNIKFHKGLNLIIDKTPSNDAFVESGNNVGKTTILRLIDFCFDAKPEIIWTDPEFKNKINNDIYTYLTENNIIVELILKESLEIEDSKEIKIERNFRHNSNKILKINGNKVTQKIYPSQLKKLIFNSESDAPSIRQIALKNIRYNGNQLENILRYLDRYTKNEEYEILYFFLFGIEIDNAKLKQKLLDELQAEIRFKSKLNIYDSEETLETKISYITSDLEKQINLKKQLFTNDDNILNIENLEQIRNQIDQILLNISTLSLREKIISEGIEKLKSDKETIDVDVIEELYNSVCEYNMTKISKTFDQLIQYNNSMVDNRIQFMQKDLDKTLIQMDYLNKTLIECKRQENELSEKLSDSSLMIDMQKIINSIRKLSHEKSHFEHQLAQLKKVNKQIKDVEFEIKEINLNIENSYIEVYKNTLVEFNTYFSDISQKLYNERFFIENRLVVNSKIPTKTANMLEVNGVFNNAGPGRKKTQIAAFEFAYVQFCDANNIKCLHFTAQDQIENIYGKQITDLINISNSINIQYIVPVIKDKLPPNLDITRYQIIELGPDDKLFKVE